MPTEKTPKTPDKRKTITFEPTAEIRQLLDQAEKATGGDRTTLINAAILENLPKVVQKLIEQRQRAAEEFFRLSKADNPSESIAFSSETTPPYRTGRNKPPKS